MRRSIVLAIVMAVVMAMSATALGQTDETADDATDRPVGRLWAFGSGTAGLDVERGIVRMWIVGGGGDHLPGAEAACGLRLRLVRVGCLRAVVTRVTDGIPVRVQLIRVDGTGTVVRSVRNSVVIIIGVAANRS